MNQGIHIRKKVSFVLQAVDDFTGHVLTGSSIRVTAKNLKPPIRKSDGYFVFLNCPLEPVEVHIVSHLFLTEVIIIDHRKYGEDVFPIKVRLKPGKDYPLPLNTTCVEGRAEEGKKVGAVFEETGLAWKLLFNYSPKKDGPRIRLYNPMGKDLEGMEFQIMNRDKSHKEFFRIVKAVKGENDYLMEEALAYEYKKAETKICTFYHTRGDIHGFYFLPVREEMGGQRECTLYYDGQAYRETLEPYIINRKDFVEGMEN